jgi:putative DNA-invertase from lambdoid prophage Rac
MGPVERAGEGVGYNRNDGQWVGLYADVTGNGISKLVFTILSAVAEAERDRIRIRERIVTVKADQRERGRYLGGRVPFGWRVDGDGGLVEIAEQQAAIQTMVAMKNDGFPPASIVEPGHQLFRGLATSSGRRG